MTARDSAQQPRIESARIASYLPKLSAIIRINDFDVINDDEALKSTLCDNLEESHNERICVLGRRPKAVGRQSGGDSLIKPQ